MTSRRYGIFAVNDSLLALDIECLREVVPCPVLNSMPGRHPALKGCFSLRGVLIPVIDLRVLMSDGSEPATLHNVVVVTSHHRVLGLLASDVQQVVDCEAQLVVDSDKEHIITGGFTLPGEQRPVSVIDADRLCALSGIPVTEQGQAETDMTGNNTIDSTIHHLMLMSSGGVPLAIDATVVHTIILNPVIESSPIKSGFCLGIIRYQNLRIPVLSLLGTLGIDQPSVPPRQAFVIRYEDGYLAFTVENIFDVVKLGHFHPMPLPARSFKDAANFIGVVSVHDLPVDTLGINGDGQQHFLLIADTQLRNRQTLRDIAHITMPDNAPQADSLQAGDGPGGKQTLHVLTVDVNGEIACRVDQVLQILPWSEGKLLTCSEGKQAGLVVSREQAIPTFCLSSVLGVPQSPVSNTASILVVQTEYGLVGFSVPRLITIDNGRPIAQSASSSTTDENAWVADAASGHVSLQTAHGPRLLTLLDLQKLGQYCLSQ
ncbi:chemotaxis protein CheW [Aquitalea sp. LB_tupeE]|uniref:chemotaxis protein CheW n=1 Tax=Aquitalea sp. LB_tupeE TaxID=2748078 RepID=UPI0015BA77FC|nr:chemotaxis protein CheW [Aquitalea sp. LB_tupeE]